MAGLLAVACGRDIDVIWAASGGGDNGGSADYDGLCLDGDDVSALLPGHWCEVPATDMRQAAPCDGELRNPVRGNHCDPDQGVTQAHYESFAMGDVAGLLWGNSIVFDSDRDQVVVWGGKSGTTQWAGNEIYAFDLEGFGWQRETEPPLLTDADLADAQEETGYYIDGTPRARKGHNTQVYAPSIRSLCALGAADLFQTGVSRPNTDCYSFAEERWVRFDDFPGVGGFNGVALWDAQRAVALLLDARAGDLYEFDPTRPPGSQWTLRGSGGRRLGQVGAVIDAHSNVVAIGNNAEGEVEVFERDGLSFSPRVVPTTGDIDAVALSWPSLSTDHESGRVLAWTGGAEVYALDLTTAEWTRAEPALTNVVEPPRHPITAEAMSRFRYVSSLGAYVVINDVDGNVTFYRPEMSL